MCTADIASRPVDIVCCSNFVVSSTTVQTVTYSDWQTANGVISRQVSQLVTPAVRVSQGAWVRSSPHLSRTLPPSLGKVMMFLDMPIERIKCSLSVDFPLGVS